MSFIWYTIWFVVAVGLLVTVHEFGHFWVARRLGFKVLRFSIGFGRPLLTRVAGADRVEYVVAAVPLGGYVKLLDEREGPVEPQDLPRSFTHRPPWQRILVLLAGPACNILFAVLVLWGMLWANGITEVRPTVGDVTAGSIAARAGLKSGDEIRAINGAAVTGQRDVVFDLLKAGRLDFRPPDTDKFRCLALAQAAACAGGLSPVVLNAANEVAVEAFLERRLNFPAIAAVIEAVMERASGGAIGGLDDVLAADADSRMHARERIVRLTPGARGAHA